MSDPETGLFERYLAGGLEPAEAADFDARLRESDELLRRFTEFLVFEEMLREGTASVLHPINRATASGGAEIPRRSLRKRVLRRPCASRRRRTTSTASMGFAAALLALVSGLVWLITHRSPASQPDTPIVLAAADAVLVVDGREHTVQTGERLVPGASLRTATAGRVSLGYQDGSILQLHALSALVIDHAAGKRLRLEHGSLRGEIAHQPAGLPLVVRTPAATATVLGTVLELTVEQAKTTLDVHRGRVELRRQSDGRSVIVGTGQRADSQDLVLRELRSPPAAVVAADPPATPGLQPLMEAEALVDAPPADAALHAGRELRPYSEALSGASGGSCIALPGVGTELVVPVPEHSGSWWLWIRYRDENRLGSELPSFSVVVDGEERLSVRVPGGSADWLWARCPVAVDEDTRVVLRSTFAGSLDPQSEVYPYRSVNRIDALRFTTDPGFDPAAGPEPE